MGFHYKMPVTSTHPEYTKRIRRWERNRDAFDGEESVKAKGKQYLIPPGGFSEKDYSRYVERAKWFGGTYRTVSGISGAVFQKDPVLIVSDNVLDHSENITLTGISSSTFAYSLFQDQILLGRYGVLLDYSNDVGRPYWAGYPAENIDGWRTSMIRGEERLTMVKLKEYVLEEKGMFDSVIDSQYRVCYLNSDGYCEVAIYKIDKDGNGYIAGDTRVLMRRGKPLDFIPFQFFGTKDLTASVARGPLDDLVNANFSYYRHSADYEHGLFLTGVPTPVITGHHLDDNEVLPIGSLSAWVIPNADAKAYLLEYQGHGLQAHEKAMEVDKQEMATQGARLLESQPDTQETLGAVQLRHSGEQGSIKSIAKLTSIGLTNLIRWHHWWHGDTEEINDPEYSYVLNTDFSLARLQPQEMQTLMMLWQAGAISKETFFWNLKQGEIIPDERSYQDEESLIDVEAPARIPFEEQSAA